MIRLLVIVFLLATATGYSQTCLERALPIDEKALLDPDDRWSNMRELSDSARDEILMELHFIDDDGNVLGDVEMFEISSCPYEYGGAKSIDMHIILIDFESKEEDKYVYALTYKGPQLAGRLMIAQLQTTCDNTFLRVCSVQEDGGIRLQQLEHLFDCQEDKFLETRQLPSLSVYMQEDGMFKEILDELPAGEDDE